VPALIAVFVGLSLAQMLSGCTFSSERPDLAPDIPPKYGAGQGVTAPPALDWWRGFRSRELTVTRAAEIGTALPF
jgi:outer membrane protein, multidrug efflux system